MATCTVTFRDARGRPLGAHVTQAESLFAACRIALGWFADPSWKGPRPDAHTILEVRLVSPEDKLYFVRAGRVLASEASHAPATAKVTDQQEPLFRKDDRSSAAARSPSAFDPQS